MIRAATPVKTTIIVFIAKILTCPLIISQWNRWIQSRGPEYRSQLVKRNHRGLQKPERYRRWPGPDVVRWIQKSNNGRHPKLEWQVISHWKRWITVDRIHLSIFSSQAGAKSATSLRLLETMWSALAALSLSTKTRAGQTICWCATTLDRFGRAFPFTWMDRLHPNAPPAKTPTIQTCAVLAKTFKSNNPILFDWNGNGNENGNDNFGYLLYVSRKAINFY